MDKRQMRFRLDVLRARPIRTVILAPAFPVLVQWLGLAAVLWLAFNGLGAGEGASRSELMTLRKTNLTTLVVWGLWWPGMIAVALAFGRTWCTVCPMEALSRAARALARKTGLPQARLGRFLRAGWVTVALYVVLQLLVAGFALHRTPHYTGLMLMALLGVAAASGFVFSDSRSFCTAFCPASALLSVYGRYTPVQLDIREPAVCEGCATRDCVSAANRDRFDRRSCPSLLQPFRRAHSDGCVVCLQCAKVCPHANVGFGVLSRASPLQARAPLRPFEVAFVLVAFGFVAHEVFAEVKWLDAWFHAVPEALRALAPAVGFGWFEALWFLVLFPAAAWALVAAAAYACGHRGRVWALFAAAAAGAAPVVAVAHLAKALAKVGSWGGYLPQALRDLRGLDTLRRLADPATAAPESLWTLSAVGWTMLLGLVLVAVQGVRGRRFAPASERVATTVGMTVVGCVYVAILAAWVLPA
jgi:polyferredoxin